MAPDADIRVEQPSSLGGLFSRMTEDLGTLVRKEVELAKVETKEEIAKATKAGGKLGAAALTGYFSLLFLSFGVAFLLAEIMPTWLGFTIVAVAYGIAAYVLMNRGREQLKTVNPVPEETVQTLKEDAQWAKNRNS